MSEQGVAQDIDELLAEVEDPAYKLTKTSRVLVGKAIVLLDQHAEAEAELAQAIEDDRRLNREPLAPTLAARVQELEAEIEASKRSFRFVSIGRKAWADLVRDHPPSKEDRKRDARSDINSETFPAAAIAASCADPKMTLEQVKRLETAIGDPQWTVLWNDCLQANLGGLSTPKSLLAGTILRASEQFATTAASGESPDQSSLDE